ncbi:hypothetical protein ACFL1H_00790 [Nanoarchaeota archaeon]
MNKQITSYIKQMMQQGYDAATIKQALITQGYTKSEIDEAFNTALGYGKPGKAEPVALNINSKMLMVVAGIVILILSVIIIMNLTGGSEDDFDSDVIGSGFTGLITDDDLDDDTTLDYSLTNDPVLGFKEMVLASYIDDEYNYVRRESNQFSIGEDVYIYFSIENFGQDDVVNGYHIELIEGIETKKDGIVISDLSASELLKVSRVLPTKKEKFEFRNRIKAEYLEMGDYEINVIIRDKILDRKIERKVQFSVTGDVVDIPLEISDFKFCDVVDEDFVCLESSDAVFDRGSDVWVLMEIRGLDQIDGIVSVKQSVDGLDSSGEQILPFSGVIFDEDNFDLEGNNFLLLKNMLDSSKVSSGIYHLLYVVKDKRTNNRVSKEVTFDIR